MKLEYPKALLGGHQTLLCLKCLVVRRLLRKTKMTKKQIKCKGTPFSDCECFCWDLTEDEYRKLVGEEWYQRELGWRNHFRKEHKKDGIEYYEEPWRIYPDDLIDLLECDKQKSTFIFGVEENE